MKTVSASINLRGFRAGLVSHWDQANDKVYNEVWSNDEHTYSVLIGHEISTCILLRLQPFSLWYRRQRGVVAAVVGKGPSRGPELVKSLAPPMEALRYVRS
ncbi:uncharacterized protein PGTG_16902 [Puccinia graminis f. sp. tritici CRL 75-36-700-3]|uniref:Uncharacterized protein n=1 Tax=Puccinia graminis f. sp. tritici (strain CRL 75-36-700-3 / race SCCL) TaxID=418459 RepID=E3L3N2_PUCGT|nr:uncharacterized protein PGTG_16902 [Puccinia graminis f. sp. tritici CRL 75-36-700-3]EFP91157.1 hypothetical protein PGTG_16902 [Puccinia graminis f. sp. tritici CRL 75-36-700-3]